MSITSETPSRVPALLLKDNITLAFDGTASGSCENFIRNIRVYAYSQDKDEDGSWMLRLATVCLLGRAVRWHAGLDAETKKDWDRFVQAMLRDFPPMNEESEVDIPVEDLDEIRATSE